MELGVWGRFAYGKQSKWMEHWGTSKMKARWADSRK